MSSSSDIVFSILSDPSIVARIRYIIEHLLLKDSSGDWMISETDITFLKDTLGYRSRITKYYNDSPKAKDIVSNANPYSDKFNIVRPDFDFCIVGVDSVYKPVWGELGGRIRVISAELLPAIKEPETGIDSAILLELVDPSANRDHRLFLAKSSLVKFGIDLAHGGWLPTGVNVTRGGGTYYGYYHHKDSLYCSLLVGRTRVSFSLVACKLKESLRQETDPSPSCDLEEGQYRGPRRGAPPRYD